MLRKSENCFLLVVVPNNNVWIVAFLAWGEQMTLIWDGDTGDQIIVGSQKVLAVRIVQISGDDTASSNHNVFFSIWVQKNWVINLAAEANSVI